MTCKAMSALILLLSVFTTVLPIGFSSRQHQHGSFSTSIARHSGLSSKLFHRNSRRSPFYNPRLKRSDRIEASIRRTFARRDYLRFKKDNKAINTNLWAVDVAEYVMEYYIGTPKRRTYAMIDSGSSLTWLQCVPCVNCFFQRKAHIFDPSRSSSFKKLTCGDERCMNLASDTSCLLDDNDDGPCQYQVHYGDNSWSIGDIAEETLHFSDNGEEVTFENFVFGCGYDNNDTIGEFRANPEGIPGLIGLTREAESLLTQLSFTRFLHCFGDIHDPEAYGFVKFGDDAKISAHSTPMDSFEYHVYYYMRLEGVSVGDVRLSLPDDLFTVKKGFDFDGCVIDSGTIYSGLPGIAYDKMALELERQMPKMKRIKKKREDFELCFQGGTANINQAPLITLHFQDLDLELPTWNTWEKAIDGCYCLAIFPTNGFSLLGSYQLQNFNVGYDLENQVISFDPYVCALDQLRH